MNLMSDNSIHVEADAAIVSERRDNQLPNDQTVRLDLSSASPRVNPNVVSNASEIVSSEIYVDVEIKSCSEIAWKYRNVWRSIILCLVSAMIGFFVGIFVKVGKI